LTPSDLFMTALYLVLEKNGRIRWASAGHWLPVRVRDAGQATAVNLGQAGLPLGIEPSVRYETVTWDIVSGERLLLFTDGVIEVADTRGNRYGLARLQKSAARLSRRCANLDDLLDSLVTEVNHYLEGSEFEDDFTLLAIERR